MVQVRAQIAAESTLAGGVVTWPPVVVSCRAGGFCRCPLPPSDVGLTTLVVSCARLSGGRVVTCEVVSFPTMGGFVAPWLLVASTNAVPPATRSAAALIPTTSPVRLRGGADGGGADGPSAPPGPRGSVGGSTAGATRVAGTVLAAPALPTAIASIAVVTAP